MSKALDVVGLASADPPSSDGVSKARMSVAPADTILGKDGEQGENPGQGSKNLTNDESSPPNPKVVEGDQSPPGLAGKAGKKKKKKTKKEASPEKEPSKSSGLSKKTGSQTAGSKPSRKTKNPPTTSKSTLQGERNKVNGRKPPPPPSPGHIAGTLHNLTLGENGVGCGASQIRYLINLIDRFNFETPEELSRGSLKGVTRLGLLHSLGRFQATGEYVPPSTTYSLPFVYTGCQLYEGQQVSVTANVPVALAHQIAAVAAPQHMAWAKQIVPASHPDANAHEEEECPNDVDRGNTKPRRRPAKKQKKTVTMYGAPVTEETRTVDLKVNPTGALYVDDYIESVVATDSENIKAALDVPVIIPSQPDEGVEWHVVDARKGFKVPSIKGSAKELVLRSILKPSIEVPVKELTTAVARAVEVGQYFRTEVRRKTQEHRAKETKLLTKKELTALSKEEEILLRDAAQAAKALAKLEPSETEVSPVTIRRKMDPVTKQHYICPPRPFAWFWAKFANQWRKRKTEPRADGTPSLYKEEKEVPPPIPEKTELNHMTQLVTQLKKFVSRPVWDVIIRQGLTADKIKRAMDNVQALFDCLVLIMPKAITSDTVIKVGEETLLGSIIDSDRVVAFWKEFVEKCSTFKCGPCEGTLSYKSLCEGSFSSICNTNFFVKLLGNTELRAVLSSRDKGEATANFWSAMTARGWSLPSPQAQERVYKKFVQIISRKKPFTDDALLLLDKVMDRVLDSFKFPEPNTVKVKLSTNATLDSTRRNLGKLGNIREEFLLWISAAPPEAEVLACPEFTITLPPGVERWKTFRLLPEDHPEIPGSFFDKIEPEEFTMIFEAGEGVGGVKPVLLNGATELFGQQIVLYALLNICRDPAAPQKTRIWAVWEAGGKARWITMMNWIDSLIQSMAQQIVVGCFSTNPLTKPMFNASESGSACCAWPYLNLYQALGNTEFYVSDFTSCTDSVDTPLARVILTKLFARYPSQKAVLDLALHSMMRPRVLYRTLHGVKEGEEPDLHVQSGIFMGDPLAKVVLTLLMLGMDAMVMAGTHAGTREFSYEDPDLAYVTPSWHCFYAPGDDHIAAGPDFYLDALMKIPKDLGMIVNSDKTFRSKYYVKLCERIFYVPNMESHIGTEEIFKPGMYEKSAWIDILKVRLFSVSAPVGCAHLESLLGRAQNISKNLSWSFVYSPEQKTALMDYFYRRLYPALPSIGSMAYYWSKLPTEVGGLGLSLSPEDERAAWYKVPVHVRRLASFALLRTRSPQAHKLRSMYRRSNVLSRDFADNPRETALRVAVMALDWKGLREPVPSDQLPPRQHHSGRSYQTLCKSLGLYTEETLEDMLLSYFQFHDQMCLAPDELRGLTLTVNSNFVHTYADQLKEFLVTKPSEQEEGKSLVMLCTPEEQHLKIDVDEEWEGRIESDVEKFQTENLYDCPSTFPPCTYNFMRQGCHQQFYRLIGPFSGIVDAPRWNLSLPLEVFKFPKKKEQVDEAAETPTIPEIESQE